MPLRNKHAAQELDAGVESFYDSVLTSLSEPHLNQSFLISPPAKLTHYIFKNVYLTHQAS